MHSKKDFSFDRLPRAIAHAAADFSLLACAAKRFKRALKEKKSERLNYLAGFRDGLRGLRKKV